MSREAFRPTHQPLGSGTWWCSSIARGRRCLSNSEQLCGRWCRPAAQRDLSCAGEDGSSVTQRGAKTGKLYTWTDGFSSIQDFTAPAIGTNPTSWHENRKFPFVRLALCWATSSYSPLTSWWQIRLRDIPGWTWAILRPSNWKHFNTLDAVLPVWILWVGSFGFF